MESHLPEWHTVVAPAADRPSEDFIRAVADFLETDADDLLAEMGYSFDEAVVGQADVAAV